MYIQYINLLDKAFRVNNVFLDEQEQFRVFVVFKRGISKVKNVVASNVIYLDVI
jgi:hypothetical protein